MGQSVTSLENEALQTGEASATVEGRTLRVRGYRQIGGSNVMCDYTIDGVAANRADAISFIGTGLRLCERSIGDFSPSNGGGEFRPGKEWRVVEQHGGVALAERVGDSAKSRFTIFTRGVGHWSYQLKDTGFTEEEGKAAFTRRVA